jgi:peroxiredoxin
MTDPVASRAVPAFELPDLEGRRIQFVPVSPGHKLLLFYKNTCPTCQLALPYFDRLCAQARGTWGYAIAQDPAPEAREFGLRYGLSVPQLVDERPHAVSRQCGIMNVPTLLVVDASGACVLWSPAFVKAHFLEALSRVAPGAEAAQLFLPHEAVPELKPG